MRQDLNSIHNHVFGLGLAHYATGIPKPTIKYIASHKLLPSEDRSIENGGNREFTIEDISTLAAMAAVGNAGVGYIKAANLLHSFRSWEAFGTYRTMVASQFLVKDWVDYLSRARNYDNILQITDGRFVYLNDLVTYSRPFGLLRFGVSRKPIFAKGQAIDIVSDFENDDKEPDPPADTFTSKLIVNLSLAARITVSRLLVD